MALLSWRVSCNYHFIVFDTIFFLVVVLVGLPALAFHTLVKIRSGAPLPPKKKRYIATSLVEFLVLAFAISAANANGFDLMPQRLPHGAAAITAFIYLPVLIFAVSRGFKRLTPEQRQKKLALLLPDTASLLPYWALLSLSAGICEEYIYRGVLFQLLYGRLRSVLLAVVVAVLAFALAHVAHGLRSTLAVAFLGLLFHVVAFETGSLYVGMIIHALYDFFVGFVVVQLIRKSAPPQAAQVQGAANA